MFKKSRSWKCPFIAESISQQAHFMHGLPPYLIFKHNTLELLLPYICFHNNKKKAEKKTASREYWWWVTIALDRQTFYLPLHPMVSTNFKWDISGMKQYLLWQLVSTTVFFFILDRLISTSRWWWKINVFIEHKNVFNWVWRMFIAI